MDTAKELQNQKFDFSKTRREKQSFFRLVVDNLIVAALTVTIFYLSLIITSAPLDSDDREAIDRSLALLEAKGFDREVFLLRAATFRTLDNWLNQLIDKENAFAATNFPFAIITVYPDFFSKAEDDTERAMILLHEAQHLKGANEAEAYEFVWRSRKKLGWTHLTHGGTSTFVTVEQQTREHTPYIFICPANLFDDCTENLQARHQQAKR